MLRVPGTGYAGGICEKDIIVMIGSVPKTRSTPLARRVAKQLGIDISLLEAGASGKVRAADVLAKNASQESAVAEPARTEITASDAVGTKDGKRIEKSVPYSGIRKVIGDRLSKSKFTAPHLYFTHKIDMTKLLALRGQVNAQSDQKTSVTDYIARACVLALMRYPEVNSSLTDDKIEQYSNVNLGIAVAAPSGLIVPVIKNAELLSVVGIATASAPLFEKARTGKLRPEEYSGGTFTVSNLGRFGIENFTAIINPPESAILAVSATKDEAVVITGEDGAKIIEARPVMNITLSVDHRLIDGLLAAQFIGEIKKLLENPLSLLI
jgi:pyruvate dehydrogenase E2 component (dihydrolipoamide acetyltransferase)